MKRSLLALALCLAACSDAPVGSAERPFTMYFVPSVDTETIALSADELTAFVARYVSRALHGTDGDFHVESAIPASYVAVVEAFATGRADFAALNTFSYILAKDIKHYPVEALVSVVRGVDEISYKAQILAHVDSGIDSIEDLAGKSFAYTDSASTAGYLLPSKLFEERGIELGETVFAMKHDNVVTMVYQRQVDAGATYYSPPKVEIVDGREVATIRDARARVKTQFPDVEEKVKIIGFTAETPNAPWVIRSNLSDDPARQRAITEAVREALLAFAATEEGRRSLEQLYDVTGLAPVDDTRYAEIREMVLESEIDVEAEAAKQ